MRCTLATPCDGRCGTHRLILTRHAHGWMAGCHCQATFKMRPGLHGDVAESEARRLFKIHVEGAP